MKKIPKEWEKAVILPIFKKGDNRRCENYRGIALLSVVEKVYERILEERLRAEFKYFDQAQSGFRKGRRL